jgi:hypothetical protein
MGREFFLNSNSTTFMERYAGRTIDHHAGRLASAQSRPDGSGTPLFKHSKLARLAHETRAEMKLIL